jgi:GTP:adenosylcobinamide-phosphate guanylyltransferase
MAVRAIILAGQREGVVGPLCEAASVARKALVPIAGLPMIDYVLAALSASSIEGPFGISGFDASYDVRLMQLPSGKGPANSALLAVKEMDVFPLLITTCDHPLLTSDMIKHFIDGAKQSGADFCVGLADKSIIQPAYPNVQRTYLNFANRSVSGCNLFYIANAKGLKVIEFWQKAQQHRKQPWKLARAFSLPLLISYLTGRLTLDRAFEHASKTLGMTAKPVMLPFAEAAIDVDKPSDKVLVEEIFARGYPNPNKSVS